MTTCKEETINHLHRNLGVETLPQLFQTVLVAAPLAQLKKSAGLLVDLAHRN